MTVSVSVPGKLFITGEYAVLTPGCPAIVMAVNRYIRVSVENSDEGVVITSDIISDDVKLRWNEKHLVFTHSNKAQISYFLRPVIVALETLKHFLESYDITIDNIHLCITSELSKGDRKLGLGSSGAVVIGVIEAVTHYCGVCLDADMRFRLGFLVSILAGSSGSGGDLAASSFGGWIEYRSPDSTLIADLIHQNGIRKTLEHDWPLYQITSLVPPKDLSYMIGWTGNPAVTSTLINQATYKNWRQSECYFSFVAQMNHYTEQMIQAIHEHDASAIYMQIHQVYNLLFNFDQQVGLGIFTPCLEHLCHIALLNGWHAKPSGAGGGDCGIAFKCHPSEESIGVLVHQWNRAGITPLELLVGQISKDEHT